ncbi:RNA ligase RtcB family protein [Rhizobium sp. TH2]|uniref:RNA ligase RtcB family protein n=1 Tax=Rhizobium sp. TH2 TaxID=2775403 RepID=UPI0021576BD6|nr:RNA ligase RtcB family protein [Rhizobium sp. TH2]UVC07064.1 RNA ligase RtcB family protein [Rhizobium sp. TH2]
MGNPSGGEIPFDASSRDRAIARFYSSATWIEGAAEKQLHDVAALAGMMSVAAFPDLHPGKYGPVGMAARSDRLYPQLVGNDIGCGMSFFELDLPLRKLKIDKAANQLRGLEDIELGDPAERLEASGMAGDYFTGALGTIGGGNHFCELQAVEDAVDGAGVDRQRLYLLVHSGSRALGASVFGDVIAANGSMPEGLEIGTEAAVAYMLDHQSALAWASLNRQMIAERAATALRADLRLVADVPHNLVQLTGNGVVHYKGAAHVAPGALAPVAGSRATLSHLVLALDGVEASLEAISHGAGRKYDRKSMHGRAGANRSEREALMTNEWGGIAICDDRDLVIEEAAGAYKDAGKVVADLASFGLIEPVATMRPLVTYKAARMEEAPPALDWKRERTFARRRNNG